MTIQDAAPTPPSSVLAIEGIFDVYRSYVMELEGQLHYARQERDASEIQERKAMQSRETALLNVRNIEITKRQLEEQIGRLNDQIDRQFTRIEELAEERDQARADLAKAATGVGNAHGESDAQSHEIEALEKRIEQLDYINEQLQEGIREREDLIKSKDKEIRKAHEVSANQEHRLAGEAKLVDELRAKNAYLAEEYDSLREYHKVALEDLNLANNDAQDRAELKKKLTAVEKELDKARNSLGDRAALAKQKDTKLAADLKKLQDENTRLTKNLDSTISKLAAEQSRAGGLEEQLEKAKAFSGDEPASMVDAHRAAAGAIRIALDILTDPVGDYELGTDEPAIVKLLTAQSALNGEIPETSDTPEGGDGDDDET